MHELSFCRSILEIINKYVSEIKCQRVKKIYLEVGQLTAIDENALKFGFNIAAVGSIAEDASLEIITIEGKAVCDFCRKTVRLKHYYDGCEICGRFLLKVIQGEELRVKSMEVD
ncbi:hydrogenase maturation nickel metallochaperone HypA [Legionella brunensis]|uniref:Hydrogenase maturation factor HypA n=1 Tax=Legionella brunensis TaxID=29422 RepID=A0A0W0SUD7_9GAMM|nr:hydrogenase maturation nickel metallochaperone HypA [Legionella brunensis]KTC86565.1 hydrogenase nickel incorporation protein HypA [Legionella brunensis]